MYKKVLAAVNEHINSEIAARYALHLCKSSGAKFYTCFVAEKETPEESLNRAQDAMKRLFAEAAKLDVVVESLSKTGETVKEIEAVVRNEEINIVFPVQIREVMFSLFRFPKILSIRPLRLLSSALCLTRSWA